MLYSFCLLEIIIIISKAIGAPLTPPHKPHYLLFAAPARRHQHGREASADVRAAEECENG